MLDRLKELIDTHEIISFDIFDTLLLRIYANPSDLFLHMEKLYNIPGFFKARIAAETNARMHSKEEEITLDKIYQELPNYFQSFKSKEIELEIAALKVNHEIYEVYKYALDKNKKVIIASDMYLSKNILINILQKNGYDQYDHFYLSSELLATKHNGTLYTQILNDFNITSPSILLHIGDNYYSDYEQAKAKGIDAYHYKKALDQLFESNIRTKIFHDQNPNDVGASILLGLLAYNHIKSETDYWKNLGYNYAGPTVFSYVFWLKKSFEKDNINNALFVARDGYSLKKVFDLMNSGEVKSSYVYAPRVLSTLFYLDFNQNKYIDPNEKFSVVKNILSHYKERNSILSDETPDINSIEEGVAFIDKHIDIYKKLAEEENKSYKNYIENLSLQKNIAIIDTCSINLSSQRLIEQIIGKQLYGYYFLLQANENANIDLNDYILRSYREDKFSWIKDWDVMEFFMTSPEPPIKDFRNGSPIYKEADKNDKIRSEIYPIISEGIVEFAKDLLSSFPNNDPFITWKNIFDWINIFCSVSTPYDKKMLSCINHAFDFNHEKYVPICKEWYDFKYETKIQVKNKIKIGKLIILKKLTKKNLSSYSFLGLPILTINKSHKNIKYHLFKIIPIYKRREKKNKIKYYVFALPMLTIKNKYY